MTQGSKSLQTKAFQFLGCTSNGLPPADQERHNSLRPSHTQEAILTVPPSSTESFLDSHGCFCPAQSTNAYEMKTVTRETVRDKQLKLRSSPYGTPRLSYRAWATSGQAGGSANLVAGKLAPPAVPTAGAASVKLVPLDLMTDNFFWQAPEFQLFVPDCLLGTWPSSHKKLVIQV
jgi:hypothetical protein